MSCLSIAAIASDGFTDFRNLTSFLTTLMFLRAAWPILWLIYSIITRSNLHSYYQNGLIIRKLDCLKYWRIFYLSTQFVTVFGMVVFGIIGYFQHRQSTIYLTYNSETRFWLIICIYLAEAIVYIWL